MPLRFTILLTLALAAGAPPARGQAPDSLVEALRSAVDRADVEGMMQQAGERLEVGLFGAARLFSRDQAEHVLEGFFRDHPPTRLTFREFVATESAWFGAAEYLRLDGREPLRVYARYRRTVGGWVLREFVVMEMNR